MLHDAPQTLQQLQLELNAEMEDGGGSNWLGSGEILSKTLSEAGLDDTLTFSRTLSSVPAVERSDTDFGDIGEMELMEGGKDVIVTNETKEAWLTATLRHKLVDCMQASADQFREGVLEVVPVDVLSLLTAGGERQ